MHGYKITLTQTYRRRSLFIISILKASIQPKPYAECLLLRYKIETA